MKLTTTIARAAMSAVLLLAATPSYAGGPIEDPTFDHLKCFQIKDRMTRTVLTADLAPEQSPPFADQNCRIELPASHFCTDVSKTNVRARNGEPYPTLDIAAQQTRDYLCYRLRCDREEVTVTATDQFRSREISTKRSDFFCAPAEQLNPVGR